MPERSTRERIQAADDAARALGMQLQVVEARRPADFDRAFAELAAGRANALVVLGTPVFDDARQRLVALAQRDRMPTMYPFRYYVDAGGLMSYGPDVLDLYRRAAIYVDRILKGEHPANMPAEQPTKFQLILNAKAARAYGLAFPAALLLRADQVVER